MKIAVSIGGIDVSAENELRIKMCHPGEPGHILSLNNFPSPREKSMYASILLMTSFITRLTIKWKQ